MPEPPPIEAFEATWKYRPVKEDTLSAQQTVMPAFTIQIVGDMEQGPPPRPGHNPGAVQKVPEAYDRTTTYDSKSMFTAMSTGSFEGQDPFNRTQQGSGMLESTEGLYVCSKRCYKLSVPTLQWTRVADLKTERAHHGLVLLPGRILVFGGLTLGRNMEYYDIKRNKWTKMKSSLPQATMAMGAALFRSLVWIAGGVVDSGSNNLDCSSAVQCYNPETKAWTFMAPTLPTSCGYLSLVSDGSSLLAVGGSVSLDQLQLGSVPDVHALSADQRTWEPMPFLPRPCHSSAAVAFGANLYVFGGISNGNVLADVQVLQKGRWTTCAHLQATLLGLSAVALPPAHATPPELDPLDKGRRDDDLIVWSWHNL
ncbi:beta-scruin [Ixodes scapularis]|uniref:beta-scruin n=1 Tax=Ixodes scapularis TaxID=6945 RepID=UPI001A9D361C|nr:beta-scruin [Ixodes scapularis]